MNKLLKNSALTVAALAIAGMTTAPQAGELNVVSWGGAYTTRQIKAYHEPSTKMTGTKISSIDYISPLI